MKNYICRIIVNEINIVSLIYIIYGICKFYIFDFCYSIHYNKFINQRKGFKNRKQKLGGKKNEKI